LIEDHIIKNKIKTKVRKCKTIRENNGIPFSSRNIRLSKKQRKVGSLIYYYLKKNKKKILNLCLKNQKKKIINRLLNFGVSKVEYLECVNFKKVKIVKSKTKIFNIFIAYYLGDIRLIDNL
jgi:pantothenate synthetase